MLALAISVAVYVVFFLTLLNALPETSALTSTVKTSLDLIAGYMQMFNFLLPIDILFQLVAIVVIVESSLFTFRLVRWVLSVVRGAKL